tara:strand:- start:616 stop:774 length:159 start_codon:yes stop_codon:yes gene_type:complete
MFITLNEFKEQYFEQLAEEHGEKRALIETEKLTQDDWIDLADQGDMTNEEIN